VLPKNATKDPLGIFQKTEEDGDIFRLLHENKPILTIKYDGFGDSLLHASAINPGEQNEAIHAIEYWHFDSESA
jgi:hypothetical protein